MSFALGVREELYAHHRPFHCQKAELAAIMDIAGSVEINAQGVAYSVRTTQSGLARRIYRNVKKLGLSPQLFARKGERLQRDSHVYLVEFRGQHQVEMLFGLLRKGNLRDALFAQSSLHLLERDCCAKAYLGGAFLAGGSVSDPTSGDYHLEFVMESELHATELCSVLQRFDLHAKIIERKGASVVYIKESKAIQSYLYHIGARESYYRYEAAIMNREMRNDANRTRNCEVANVQRAIEAGLRQVDALHWLVSHGGWDKLPESLVHVAKIRFDSPEATLQEIAELSALSKSAVNYRLRRICTLATQYGWVPRDN